MTIGLHGTIVVIALSALVGCAPSAEKPSGADPGSGGAKTATVPDAPPSMTGTVTAIGPGRTLRIEVDPSERAGSDKAQVKIPEDAAILERSGAARRFEDIRQGGKVSAWYTGPVAESYPVQATARVVVIEPADVSHAASDSAVGFMGFGPVRAGMTLAEAGQALGVRLELVHPQESCTFAFLGGRPAVAFMVIDGRIARVDIQEGPVKTSEGAGIGDTEARIHSLYPGRVEVQPHKYVAGRYLIVRPAAPADSAYRLVFETDGARVTRYRAGRLPEVRWVEGCS